jgi:hypothetical protein
MTFLLYRIWLPWTYLNVVNKYHLMDLPTSEGQGPIISSLSASNSIVWDFPKLSTIFPVIWTAVPTVNLQTEQKQKVWKIEIKVNTPYFTLWQEWEKGRPVALSNRHHYIAQQMQQFSEFVQSVTIRKLQREKRFRILLLKKARLVLDDMKIGICKQCKGNGIMTEQNELCSKRSRVSCDRTQLRPMCEFNTEYAVSQLLSSQLHDSNLFHHSIDSSMQYIYIYICIHTIWNECLGKPVDQCFYRWVMVWFCKITVWTILKLIQWSFSLVLSCHCRYSMHAIVVQMCYTKVIVLWTDIGKIKTLVSCSWL